VSYVKNGISQLDSRLEEAWLAHRRQQAGEERSSLWQRLDALVAGHDVQWHWVKGHSGDPGNERADALANRGVASLRAG
jgi:ribonuclease HI